MKKLNTLVLGLAAAGVLLASIARFAGATGLTGIAVGQPTKTSGVGTSQIADGAVTTAKLAGGVVTAASIADGSITTAKLADAAVTTAKHAPQSVTTSKLYLDLTTTGIPCITTAKTLGICTALTLAGACNACN